MGGFPIDRVGLSSANLADAILASGSIPLVLDGVRDITGAPPGTYRDGGVIDYHLDLPAAANGKLALFPHFFDWFKPGWFDKRLAWRQVSPANFSQTLVICPSAEFVASLPGGKVPDRTDFVRLPTGPDALGEGPLRDELELRAPALVELREHGRVRRARVRADHLGDATRLDERREPDLAAPGVVVDDRQVLGPAGRSARGCSSMGLPAFAEATDHDGGPIEECPRRQTPRRSATRLSIIPITVVGEAWIGQRRDDLVTCRPAE